MSDLVNNKERVKAELFVQIQNDGRPFIFMDLNWKINDNFIALSLCKTKFEYKQLLALINLERRKYEIHEPEDGMWCVLFPGRKNNKNEIYIQIRIDEEELLFSIEREIFNEILISYEKWFQG